MNYLKNKLTMYRAQQEFNSKLKIEKTDISQKVIEVWNFLFEICINCFQLLCAYKQQQRDVFSGDY